MTTRSRAYIWKSYKKGGYAMDISNNEMFVKQLQTLKKCNFRQYIWTCRWYFIGFIIIEFIKILSDYSLKMAFVEAGFLIILELIFYYWVYCFFRKITYEEKFSSKNYLQDIFRYVMRYVYCSGRFGEICF